MQRPTKKLVSDSAHSSSSSSGIYRAIAALSPSHESKHAQLPTSPVRQQSLQGETHWSDLSLILPPLPLPPTPSINIPTFPLDFGLTLDDRVDAAPVSLKR